MVDSVNTSKIKACSLSVHLRRWGVNVSWLSCWHVRKFDIILMFSKMNSGHSVMVQRSASSD